MKFEITEKQLKQIEEIKKAIKLLYNEYDGCVEYRFSLCNVVGESLSIYVPILNKEFDITDYEKW